VKRKRKSTAQASAGQMEVIGMLSSHPVRIAKCGTVATSGVQKASKLERGKEFPQPSIPSESDPAIAVQQAM
jgi:hypothetical protein